MVFYRLKYQKAVGKEKQRTKRKRKEGLRTRKVIRFTKHTYIQLLLKPGLRI